MQRFYPFTITIVIGILVGLIFYKSERSKIHINEIVNMSPLSSYTVTRLDYLPQGVDIPTTGKLGDLYYCLMSYKELGTWKGEGKGKGRAGNPSGVFKIKIDNYELYFSMIGTKLYQLFLSKFSYKKELWNTSVSVRCDISLLNKTQKDENITPFLNSINENTSFKNLYVSHPNIEKPKIIGHLGAFYKCLRNFKPWQRRGGIKEQGMVKLDLNGFILHLGVKDNTAINFMIEKYGDKNKILAHSKVYKITCDINLLQPI